jgi:hypothetical protein
MWGLSRMLGPYDQEHRVRLPLVGFGTRPFGVGIRGRDSGPGPGESIQGPGGKRIESRPGKRKKKKMILGVDMSYEAWDNTPSLETSTGETR